MYPLVDLDLEAESYTINAPPGAMVFTLSEGADQPTPATITVCRWTLYPGDQAWETTHMPVTYDTNATGMNVLPAEDVSLNVTVLCSNMVTQNYTMSILIDVLVDDIDIVSFESDPDWWRNATLFTLTLEPNINPVSFQFDMGNGRSCSLNDEGTSPEPNCTFSIDNDGSHVVLTLQYTYDHWGDFVVVMNATNGIPLYDDGATLTASVLEWTCFAPTLELPTEVADSAVHEVMRSDEYNVEVVATPNCMKTQQVS